MSVETLSLTLRVQFPAFRLDMAEVLPLQGMTAVFGPSGGGKSTLLRSIAGFVSPQQGRIACGNETWFDSAADVDVAPHRRPVGFMFQDAMLFPHLDVAGNLAFAGKRGRVRAAGITREGVIAALDLGPLLNRRTGELSGGERQRVALGRTLLTNPELLLLDEPLSALDRDRKAEILPYLENLPARFGLPVIYVSHGVDEIAQLADRVLVLAEGQVQAFDTAPAIMERFDLQPFTGRFDAGVLADGRVLRHDSRLKLTYVHLHGETLAMPMSEHIAPGSPIRLRIRARDVAIATSRPQNLSIRNILAGTVAEISSEADSGLADVVIETGGGRIRARVTRASVEDLRLEHGMPVFALIRSVSFERADGRR